MSSGNEKHMALELGGKNPLIGRENISPVIEEFTRVKTVYVDLTETKRRPWNEM
jgi:hypothetical protein